MFLKVEVKVWILKVVIFYVLLYSLLWVWLVFMYFEIIVYSVWGEIVENIVDEELERGNINCILMYFFINK